VERYLAIFLGVLILGSLGAFLLYVPVLPLALVVTLLLSLVLVFILGVHTGRRRIRISRGSRLVDGLRRLAESGEDLR